VMGSAILQAHKTKLASWQWKSYSNPEMTRTRMPAMADRKTV